jgi:hypothetical protein
MSTAPRSQASFKHRAVADFLDEWRREHPQRPLATVPAAQASGSAQTTPHGIRTDYAAPQYVPFGTAAESGHKYGGSSSLQARNLSSVGVTRSTSRGTKPFLKASSSSASPPSHKHNGLSSLHTLGFPPAAVARRPGTAAGFDYRVGRAQLSSSATFQPVSTTPSGGASSLTTAHYAAPAAALASERTGNDTSADTRQPAQTATDTSTTRSYSPPVTPVKEVVETETQEMHLRTCKERTFVILDWDDTLLPTCASTAYSFDIPLPRSIRATLDTLSNDVLALLAVCRAHGQVMIITNAAHGWVEDSGKYFLPAVLSYLQQHSIPIISAQHEWYQHRQLYHRQFYSLLHDPAQWKPASFATHALAAGRALQDGDGSLGSWDGERKLNLISIGDSVFERMAAHALMQRPTSRLYVGLCKTIKFDDNPTFARLRVQIQSLTAAIPALATGTTSMDLDMKTT